jgi:hypothetical protein
MHPTQTAEAVQSARRLWSDDTVVGTLAAVALVALFVLWPAYRFYTAHRVGGER